MADKVPDLKKGRKWWIAEATARKRLEGEDPNAGDLELLIEHSADNALTVPGQIEDDVPVEDIEVGDRLRGLDDEVVARLAESIAEDGLHTPITVWTEAGRITGDNRIRLVAGRHRLEACRRLGLDHIAAFVISGDELDCQLREIDENLMRSELTKLEIAEHHKRRKEILEARGDVVTHGGDRKSKRQDGGLKSYTKDTAEKLGVDERTIQRATRRAEKIAPDIKEAIKGTPAANKGAELDCLAAMTHDQQRAALKLVEEGTVSSFAQAREQDHTQRNLIKDVERMVSQLLRILGGDGDQQDFTGNNFRAYAEYASPAEVQNLLTQLDHLSDRIGHYKAWINDSVRRAASMKDTAAAEKPGK